MLPSLLLSNTLLTLLHSFTMSFRSKPTRVLKKGIDREDALRKREEVTIELRKNKREEQVQKRRMMRPGQAEGVSGGAADAATTAANNAARNAEIAEKLKLIPQLVAAVNSENPQAQIEAVTQFRKLLSIGKPYSSEQLHAS